MIGLIGDGSAMYAIQGLWSAAELALPVTFVIVNNGSYRALDEFAPHFGLARAARHHACASGFLRAGARPGRGRRCGSSSCGELDAALRVAFAATGPVLVEVCVAD